MSKHYHFIGIGGIGMSALAHLALQKGHKVSGSDLNVHKDTVIALQKKGAHIVLGHKAQNITPGSHVVYSSAINGDNAELQEAQQKGCMLQHRSDFLAEEIKDSLPLLIAGTHGKTTTSALLSHVLSYALKDPSYLLGGMVKNFSQHGYCGRGKYFVVETDESDGSFLKTPGFGAIITNIDDDHLNYWKDFHQLQEGFKRFSQNIQNQELLFWCADDPALEALQLSGISYGFSSQADLCISAWKKEKVSQFTLTFLEKTYKDISLKLLGKCNVLNAAAVFGMALCLGIKEDIIREAFMSFLGVKRRQEWIGEVRSTVFYHDYAHHPVAIKEMVETFKSHHLHQRVVVLFQPHRYSRMRDSWKKIASAFMGADHVVVTDIYSAGEKPIENITSPAIADLIQKQTSCMYVPKEELMTYFSSFLRPHDLVLTLGAGDIETITGDIFCQYTKAPNKLKVALVFGGKSSEHEVSQLSAQYIDQQLDRDLYDVVHFYITKKGQWIERAQEILFAKDVNAIEESAATPFPTSILEANVCFPVLHGQNGEDGAMQGFLDILGIPYVGCDHFSSALSMDKAWSKRIAQSYDIPCGPYIDCSWRQWEHESEIIEKKIHKLKLPLFVKPVHFGSSLGIIVAHTYEEALRGMQKALKYDTKVIVEEKIMGKEIEVGIVGNQKIIVGMPGELMTNGHMHTYEGKYGESGFVTKIPANISQKQIKEVQELAKKIYQILECSGMARVDFFLDEEKGFIFNEINPIPGCTRNSPFPKMFGHVGLEGKPLINYLLALAVNKIDKKKVVYD